MPKTPPAAVERDDRKEITQIEFGNVYRKLLEAEFMVALDTATKENPAFGLTYDGWTAIRMLAAKIPNRRDDLDKAASSPTRRPSPSSAAPASAKDRFPSAYRRPENQT